MKIYLERVLVGRNTVDQKTLLTELQGILIQRRHAAALPILQAVMKLKVALHSQQACSIDEAQRAVMDYMSALANVIPHPSDTLLQELCTVGQIVECTDLFSPVESKNMCAKALRMYLLLHGRDERQVVLDELMLSCHRKLLSSQSTEVCAFCEESPQRAALTLSRCGRCKQVMYCSAGCQKAHRKLHKKGCKAV